jgi:hypothetical protein
MPRHEPFVEADRGRSQPFLDRRIGKMCQYWPRVAMLRLSARVMGSRPNPAASRRALRSLLSLSRARLARWRVPHSPRRKPSSSRYPRRTRACPFAIDEPLECVEALFPAIVTPDPAREGGPGICRPSGCPPTERASSTCLRRTATRPERRRCPRRSTWSSAGRSGRCSSRSPACS